jgi:alcohol dehydrogenase (cytochrome c)
MRLFAALVLTTIAFAQAPDSGRKQFESHCTSCHGGDGNGGELGPGIVERAANRSDQELTALIRGGIPAAGMPAFKVTDQEMPGLIAYVRSLKPRGDAPVHLSVKTTDGGTLEGDVLNRGLSDLQLRTGDQRVHLLRIEGDRYREVTSQTDWPGYHGLPNGNRYTTIDQVKPSNVAKLAPKWMFNLPNTSPSENTPVVVEGIMYVSSGNECYALDAGTGRPVWH